MRLGVPVMVSAMVAAAAGLAAPSIGAQERQFRCAADHDATVTAAAAQGCAEQSSDLARGGADGLAREQFGGALPDADGLRQQFGQVDRDGDGRISRDEWMAWFGPAHADGRPQRSPQPQRGGWSLSGASPPAR